MEADRPHFPTERAEGERIHLEAICAYAWSGGVRSDFDDLASNETLRSLSAANMANEPIWLKLAMPALSDEVRQYFEGSQPAWSYPTAPIVEWSPLDPILKAVGLAGKSQDPVPEAQRVSFLRVLPHVYSRGIFRTIREVSPAVGSGLPEQPGNANADVQLFPIVGFRRSDEATGAKLNRDDRSITQLTIDELNALAPEFWAFRLNVGAIGNVVITIRLPDVRFGGRIAEEPHYELRDENKKLELPERFLPLRQPARAEVAEGIALHHAATARDVAEQLRNELSIIERIADTSRRADDEVRRRRQERRQRVLALQEALLDMQQTIDQLDRQISRLLRRFGAFGEEGSKSVERVAPPEVKLRYQFGLDEIRSLRADTRLAGAALQARISARDARDRERFEIAAALLGALVLIPTLVAGLYGANVEYPGEGDPLGLWILVATLVFCTSLVTLGMSVAWTRNWDPLSAFINREFVHKTMAVVLSVSCGALVGLLTVAVGWWLLIGLLLLCAALASGGLLLARSRRWELAAVLFRQERVRRFAWRTAIGCSAAGLGLLAFAIY